MRGRTGRRTGDGRWRPGRITAGLVLLACVVAGLPVRVLGQVGSGPPPSILSLSYSYTPSADTEAAGIRLVSREFAPRWTASYGMAPADQTSLTWAYLRYDSSRAFGTSNDASSRDRWRQFLGVQYAAGDDVTLAGGIARAAGVPGVKASGLWPSGYERMRLSTSARWLREPWALDGTFSFIPAGASRVPGDASFVPGANDSSATYFVAVTISLQF
jgi:hypothetical protein